MKKQIKFLSLALISISLINCSEDKGDCCSSIDAVIRFTVSSNDADMLNPLNPNSFDHSDIRILYNKNSDLIEAFSGQFTHTYGYYIYESVDSIYTLALLVGQANPEHERPLYVKWDRSNTQLDTVDYEITRNGNSERVSKVWVNGEVRWSGSGQRLIHIEK